ncbi:LCP family protein [Candidatus Clostridium stratigraminis]|uniref:LCP family protein n=1 Tax=Candidatus Clostridium stratigraminis TaxID=3381661 RepID=A0ABW8T4H2_9CLOT
MGRIKRSHSFRDFFIIFASLFVCISLAGAGYLYFYLDGLNHTKLEKNKVQPIAANKDEQVNILAMGTDVGTIGANSNNNPKRTDTILLINLNPSLKVANVISIPRDTLIQMNNSNKKINEANAIGGPGYLIDAVEKLLDIRVNYYSKLDYEGFRKVIDSIGPIEMTINNNMNYDDKTQNLHIHFNKGDTVELNGEKAEEFFRWRENNDGTGLANGDLGRIENQHLFINKVIDKFKNPSIITKLPSILGTISNYVETNMKADEIIKYGLMLSKMDKANIKIYTIKGDPKYINGISYVIYDKSKNIELLNKLHSEAAMK